MKKISLFFAVFLTAFLFLGTVNAKTVNVASTDDLSAKIGEAEEGDTLVLEDGTYTGNITIDKALTIEGTSKEDTIIVGQITVTDNFDMKNVTVIGEYVNDTYQNVVTITKPELVVNFDNVNLNVKDYVADKDYKTRVSGIRVDADANGTKLTVTNSNINATYGIYVKSEKNTIKIESSIVSGWAALDITTSEGVLQNNNKVTVKNTTLYGTSYVPKADDNNYGVVVIGSQKDLSLTITDSTIKNNIVTENRIDLIYFGDYYEDSETSIITLNNVKLENNDTNGESTKVNFGTEGNALGGQIFIFDEKTNLDMTTDADMAGSTSHVFNLSSIDGVASIIVPDGFVVTADALEVGTVEGYEFKGWYTDAEYKNEFLAGTEITEDTTIYAYFVEIVEDTTPEVNNPQTGDNILIFFLVGLISLIGFVSGSVYFLKHQN